MVTVNPAASACCHEEHEEEMHFESDEEAHNLNLQGIFLHILADALGSVGVIISSLVIHYFEWYLADALCSIFISVLIIASVIPLIKSSGRILLQRTPATFENKLKFSLQKIPSLPGVVGYRDAHFWDHSNGSIVGTIHIQVKEDADEQTVLTAVNTFFSQNLKGSHTINNLSIQIEKEQFLNILDPEKRMLIS